MTGGDGFLGAATVDEASSRGHEVMATTRRPGTAAESLSRVEVDLRNHAAVLDVVGALRPDGIVHTAYVRDGAAAAATIVDASRSVAPAAASVGAHLVHVSTDVVFPDGPSAWHEGDLPAPQSTYGLLKRQAEVEVTTVLPDTAVVRTSLLYGAPGRSGAQEALVVRALQGEPISFFTDEIRCPLHVDDVAAGLVSVAEQRISGIVHLAGPDPLDRLALAKALARRLGLDDAALRGAPTPISSPPRPARVVLGCDRYDRLVGGVRRSVR